MEVDDVTVSSSSSLPTSCPEHESCEINDAEESVWKNFMIAAADLLNFVVVQKYTKSRQQEEDVQEALESLHKAMRRGSYRAAYNIGIIHEKQNRKYTAHRYFKLATRAGHPMAAYNCAGHAFKKGKTEKGFKLLRYALKSGVHEAKAALKAAEEFFMSSG